MATQRPDTPLASTPEPEHGKTSTSVKSDTVKGRDIPLAETTIVKSKTTEDNKQSKGGYSSRATSYSEVTKPDNSKNTQYTEQKGKRYSSTFVTRDSSGKPTAAQVDKKNFFGSSSKITNDPAKIERLESKAKNRLSR